MILSILLAIAQHGDGNGFAEAVGVLPSTDYVDHHSELLHLTCGWCGTVMRVSPNPAAHTSTGICCRCIELVLPESRAAGSADAPTHRRAAA